MKGKKMEEKIVYFEKPGKENTAEVIKLVLERAKSRNINRIVLASTTGYSAKLFLDAVEVFSSNPAVSISSTERESIWHRALTQSRVVPLMSVTIAFCRPVR